MPHLTTPTTPFSPCTHLRKICDLHVPLCLDYFTTVRLQPAHYYLQLCRLARAIDACAAQPAQQEQVKPTRSTIQTWNIPHRVNPQQA
jgi:hypothetical protein